MVVDVVLGVVFVVFCEVVVCVIWVNGMCFIVCLFDGLIVLVMVVGLVGGI